MTIYGLGEPGLGTCIIIAGVWLNRNTTVRELKSTFLRDTSSNKEVPDIVLHETSESDRSAAANISKRRFSNAPAAPTRWRKRELRFFGLSKTIHTPNTAVWENTIPSRILYRFPFLMELIYWSLIYGVSAAFCQDISSTLP